MDEQNPFEELLALLSYEDLLRLTRRAQIRKNPRMADFLIKEVMKRDEIRKTYFRAG